MQAPVVTRTANNHRYIDLRMVVQTLALLLIALVAGSTFGIWRGYNPADYSALTFLETHQGAVHGLNTLLPAMGFGALACTVILAWLNRRDPTLVAAYGAALVLIAAAGAITRLFNQPINAQVMTWTVDTLPNSWTAIRDNWWNWHIARTLVSISGMLALLIAVLLERSRR